MSATFSSPTLQASAKHGTGGKSNKNKVSVPGRATLVITGAVPQVDSSSSNRLALPGAAALVVTATTPTVTVTSSPSCGDTLQSLIDATPTGGTLTVPACVYRESVIVNRSMTIIGTGATIDGRDSSGNLVRSTWLYVSANDVTVRGFKMQFAAGTNSMGSVENAVGVQRFILENCDISYSYVNVNLTGAIDSIIRNNSIHDAIHLGVRVSAPNSTTRGLRNTLSGNHIYNNNNVGEPDPGGDAAGVKATYQNFLTITGNEVDHNSANAVWLDADCQSAIITANRVHDNTGPGIFDETSTGSKISSNVSWRNGAADTTFGFGAGILIASSKNAEVWNNTCAWNFAGISVIDQNRGDNPGVTGNYVHDNVVTEAQMAAGVDHFGSFWANDYVGSQMYTAAANNRGLNNRFFYANADGSLAPENSYARFIWDGYRNMASFQTTPGGAGSTYMSLSDKNTALTAAGVPLTP